ncbi:unnamed protein product, partial [Iphiclides podalirius]
MFCLVVGSARLTQSVLMDLLAAQCIPIIIADTVVLPFNSHLDWHRTSLYIPEENIKNLLRIVHSVSNERRGELYWQLRWVYERYFASIEKITLTTLEIINEKVFPLAARMYEDWNMPEHLYGPVNPLFLPVTAPKSPGFTAVILTYDRVDSLFTLIRKLVRTPSLAKILVVWNNQRKAPPPSSEWPVINKPLKVIRTRENKLSNRFYPYDEIETECQLTIDDDIIMLTPDELEFGFDVWREFPDRIVGFPSRLHVWDNATASWKYHSEWTNQISMVLTGAAFHHKIWSWYYTHKMPAEIRDWVDEIFNCEDIAMNFLVANVTRKPPIKVTPRKKFKCPECTAAEALSADARHMAQRSACVHRFATAYGRMALSSVEFRADPLQYREPPAGAPHLYPAPVPLEPGPQLSPSARKAHYPASLKPGPRLLSGGRSARYPTSLEPGPQLPAPQRQARSCPLLKTRPILASAAQTGPQLPPPEGSSSSQRCVGPARNYRRSSPARFRRVLR